MDTDRALAYWLQGESIASGTPASYFPFLKEKGHVISLVGAGGKTTLMHYLARCFCRHGHRIAVMTTTRIFRPDSFCRTMQECLACWEKGGYAVCGEPVDGGKLTAPSGQFLMQLLEEADTVLIEADGSRRMPCKAPAAHEPVILPETDVVIGVMGLSALGRSVGEACHRCVQVQQILCCSEEHVLAAEDLAVLLMSGEGSRKGVDHRDYYVVLNQCDDACRLREGRRILDLIRLQGQSRAVLTSGMAFTESMYSAPQNTDAACICRIEIL